MQSLLALRDAEGLTYRELSERSGASIASLSWWSWKLRREKREFGAFAEVQIVSNAADAVAERDVQLEVACGPAIIRVGRDFDADVLRDVVVVLAQC